MGISQSDEFLVTWDYGRKLEEFYAKLRECLQQNEQKETIREANKENSDKVEKVNNEKDDAKNEETDSQERVDNEIPFDKPVFEEPEKVIMEPKQTETEDV